MSKTEKPSNPTVEISYLEEKYKGKKINLQNFHKLFSPNGTMNYVYYFELEDFLSDYEDEDPRLIDYPPDSDEEDDERYLDLPYPDISLFTEIKSENDGVAILDDLSICKVYSTGCYTPGAHSGVLIQAEVDRIIEIMDSILV